MNNNELLEKIEAIEMTHYMLFLLLIKTSPNPQLIIDTAKQLIEMCGETGNPISDIAKKHILSIVESAENAPKS